MARASQQAEATVPLVERRVVFLLDASSRIEQRLLRACLAGDDDPLLTPLRVAWLTPKRKRSWARRVARFALIGDPRDPGRLRQWMSCRSPERFQIVAGDAATVTELRERWVQAGGPGS